MDLIGGAEFSGPTVDQEITRWHGHRGIAVCIRNRELQGAEKPVLVEHRSAGVKIWADKRKHTRIPTGVHQPSLRAEPIVHERTVKGGRAGSGEHVKACDA